MVKAIFIFSIFSIVSHSILPQPNENYRFPRQHYFEDSTSVFWTWYPNPFSPPTVIGHIDYDSVKTVNCHSYSFYCDLSDTVIVAFVDISDSIYYSKSVTAGIPKHFKFCLWTAGIKISPNDLPKKYFYCSDANKLKVILIVEGRKKCFKEFEYNNRLAWIE